MTAVGDSLLQGMEAAICWPSLSCSDVGCCEQIDKALSSMLLHVSINLSVRGGLVSIKCEHETLGLRIKGHGDLGGFLISAAGEQEGLEERWRRVGRSTNSCTVGGDNNNLFFMTKAPSLMIKKAHLRIGRTELIKWEKTSFFSIGWLECSGQL